MVPSFLFALPFLFAHSIPSRKLYASKGPLKLLDSVSPKFASLVKTACQFAKRRKTAIEAFSA